MTLFVRKTLLLSSSASLLIGLGSPAISQTVAAAGDNNTTLPSIVVEAPKQVAGTPKQRPKPRATAQSAASRPTAPPTPVSPAEQLAAKASVFDQARGNLYTTIGTTSDTISHQTIQDLPEGTNQSVERVLLQAPGLKTLTQITILLRARSLPSNC